MPTFYVSKSSSHCCASFVRRLELSALPSMVVCFRCEAAYALCVFTEHLLKCTECVRKSCSYDSNFSGEDFNRIKEKKEKLQRAL
jgi:Zn ribbon nucleic-acid-binding protein